MSNKYGDKIEGIKPPKVEQNVEEKKETITPPQSQPVTNHARQQIEPPRPNSNFSKTVEEARPSREVKSGGRVKMAMTDYVLSMKEARNSDETSKAQMKFWNLIRSILIQSDFATFKQEWTDLLNFININKDDVNVITINRAVEVWPLDGRQQKVFSVFSLLAVLTADPRKRRDPQGISGDDVLEHASRLGRKASYNIGAYYNFE